MYINTRLSEYRAFLKGKTASVIGVGISNLPLIDFLCESGVRVTARDRKSREALTANPKLDMERLEKNGVRFVTGEGYLENIGEELIFKSPGIRFDKPEIQKAMANGAIVTSEMEAFLSLCPAKVIAVTGSNGKTTTTTLVSEMLKNAGKTVHLGGNIGRPLLANIESIAPEDFVVLELSSFQLHTVNRFENAGLPFAHITFPDVGVLTNVSPNHLDWHTDMEEYAVSKRAIFTHMDSHGVFVTNRASDAYVRRFAAEAADEGHFVRTFSAHDGVAADGACVRDGYLTVNGQPLFPLSELRVPGLHNVENFMAAALAVWDYVPPDALLKTAQTFTGVAHRLELVAEKDGVRFYNSSIDSSPSRTEAALSCFGKEYDGRICLILGGYDKHIPFEPLAKPVCEHKCRAFITGATGDAIYNAITQSEFYDPTEVMTVRCADFRAAVRAACAAALPGDVVVLSPACASFDEFSNFEERGEAFRALVRSFVEAQD